MMIVRAGMKPKAIDRPGPSQVGRSVHQPTTGTFTLAVRCHPKEREFAFAIIAEIKLEQPFIFARNLKGVDLHLGMADDAH